MNSDVIEKTHGAKTPADSPDGIPNQAGGGGGQRAEAPQPNPNLDPREDPLAGERAQFLRQQADAGDPQAQFEYGQYLFFGNDELGIPKQPEEADKYFRMAANSNHRAGSINYAIMLINSRLRLDSQNQTEPLKKLSSPSRSFRISKIQDIQWH